MEPKVLPGINTLLRQKDDYRTQRIALVTNNAGKDASGTMTRVALLHQQYKIIRLFSPEHGITVKGDDGVRQQGGRDIVTGLPVVSLYSEKMAPSEEDLRDIDLVLFDIPDVGCRFYTYLWTMTYVMEACSAVGKPFVVLDRPNPIGALLEHAEGPMLDEGQCASFIGRWNIPLKHSCTLGELARYFAAIRLPSLQIEVVKATGYYRHHTALDDFSFCSYIARYSGHPYGDALSGYRLTGRHTCKRRKGYRTSILPVWRTMDECGRALRGYT